MTEKTELHLGDFQMEEHYIGEDLVWGMKSWRDLDISDVQLYVYEVRYRIPDSDHVVYLREKVVGDPKMASTPDQMTIVPQLVSRLIHVLTDPEYRKQLHDLDLAQRAELESKAVLACGDWPAPCNHDPAHEG